MPASQKHKAGQRDKVLLAARKCFVRHGFHGTGMAEIAKTCRMSVGNIYHYFPHKSSIVQAIADETRARLFPALEHLQGHPDPVEGLVEIMIFNVRQLRSGSNARLWMEILAEAPRNKTIGKICLNFDQEFRAILERMLQRAVDGRKLSAQLNLAGASLWLVALLDGAIARLSVEPGIDLEPALEALAQSIRRGLSAA